MAAVVLRPDTADLAVAFDGAAALEPFNDSAGYEGWRISAADGFQAVATGGGQLAIWDARGPPAGAAP